MQYPILTILITLSLVTMLGCANKNNLSSQADAQAPIIAQANDSDEVTLQPGTFDYHRMLAENHIAQKAYLKGIKELHTELHYYPHNSEARLLLIDIYYVVSRSILKYAEEKIDHEEKNQDCESSKKSFLNALQTLEAGLKIEYPQPSKSDLARFNHVKGFMIFEFTNRIDNALIAHNIAFDLEAKQKTYNDVTDDMLRAIIFSEHKDAGKQQICAWQDFPEKLNANQKADLCDTSKRFISEAMTLENQNDYTIRNLGLYEAFCQNNVEAGRKHLLHAATLNASQTNLSWMTLINMLVN